MGWADRLEVHSILKQADILINISEQDCNYKFFDYIHVNKPILANKGLPENILTHKYNAYLTDNFKEGLRELIENNKLREKLEKNIKKYKTYSWEEIADMHLDIYKKMIPFLRKIKKYNGS